MRNSMWPCACCYTAATHRDEYGNARCEEHRLSEDIDRMDAERLRQLVRNLQTHLQIAATFSDRERSLQTNLDALREKHRRYVTALIAEIRRLRAIEEAARQYHEAASNNVTWSQKVSDWDQFTAALAAKEGDNGKA